MAAAVLGPIIGQIGGSLIGGLLGRNQQNRQRNDMLGVLQRAMEGDRVAQETWWNIAGPLLARTDEVGQTFQRQLVDMLPYLNESIGNIQAGANERFNNNPFQEGGQQYQDFFRQLAGGLQGTGDTANAVFQGGGWTPQYQELFDRLSPFMSGRGSNSQMALDDVGSNLIGQRGQTAQTQALWDRAIDASNNQGMNPRLEEAMTRALGILGNEGRSQSGNALLGNATDILRSGGMTPEGQQGSLEALRGVLGGGRTQGSDFMTRRGQDLAGREALLPMDLAVSSARDEAGNRLRQGARAALRQARARGGGQFSMGNDELFDSQMEIASGIGDAANRQRINQQGLQQQENQIGAGLLQGGEGAATSRLGQFADLLTGLQNAGTSRLGVGSNLATELERIAAGREGTAFGAIPGTQGAATNIMQALLSAGLQGGNLENERMQTGTGMSNAFINSIMQSFGQQNTGMGNQNQYALGAGNLGLNTALGQGNLGNMGFGAFERTGRLGMDQASAWTNALMQTEQGRQALYNLGLQGWGQSAGIQSGLAGQQNNTRQSYIGLQNPFGPLANQQNPWGNLGQSVAGGIGNIIGSRPGQNPVAGGGLI